MVKQHKGRVLGSSTERLIVNVILQGLKYLLPYCDRYIQLYSFFLFFFLVCVGSILLVSSTDDPQSVVSKMEKNTALSGRMVGRYHLVGDIVSSFHLLSGSKESSGNQRANIKVYLYPQIFFFDMWKRCISVVHCTNIHRKGANK